MLFERWRQLGRGELDVEFTRGFPVIDRDQFL
jgi:hypothetical protein